MIKSAATRPLWILGTLLLACVLAIPGSTSALPTDFSDLDAPGPGGSSPSSTRSLWDAPATLAAVAIPAAESQAPAVPKPGESANPLWAIPIATLSNTRERPIFSASRRPPPPAVVSAPVVKAPPPPKPPRVERPQLSLVGTIAGDDQSFGIFVDQSTRAALRLKIGEEFQGWKLKSVNSREVTLERDEQVTTLSLPRPAAGAAAQVNVQTESNVAQGMDAPPIRGNRR